jgi:hypothetical protein
MQEVRGEDILAYPKPRPMQQMRRNRRAEGQPGWEEEFSIDLLHQTSPQQVLTSSSMLMNYPGLHQSA